MTTTRERVLFLAMSLVCILLMLPFILLIHADVEVDALHAFRTALGDPNNVLESWDPNLVSPCTYNHITCHGQYVIRIDLGNNDLSGHLVPDLGNLTKLQYLEVYNSTLIGSIPPELGKLKDLISLDLYNNMLNGSIPKTLGNLPKLKFLRLQNNNLSGRTPVKELVPIGIRGIVDVSNNPHLCTNFTYPPCPPNI